jgi:hypothetical protein
MTMRAPRMRAFALLLLLATGGCTLIVGAELAGKPEGTGGEGGAGGDATSSSVTSSSSKSSATTTSSSGAPCVGPTCPCAPNMANCGGIPIGCNVNLMTDPQNCGACHVMCSIGMPVCSAGKCGK